VQYISLDDGHTEGRRLNTPAGADARRDKRGRCGMASTLERACLSGAPASLFVY